MRTVKLDGKTPGIGVNIFKMFELETTTHLINFDDQLQEMVGHVKDTPLKINMEPGNDGFQ